MDRGFERSDVSLRFRIAEANVEPNPHRRNRVISWGFHPLARATGSRHAGARTEHEHSDSVPSHPAREDLNVTHLTETDETLC
ncbi:hypothetical protein SAMN04488239_1376 [Ruegeria marina]|uniref:Uncharacterized protein n=1 Tax=Ruegeria marina TaxID=639004 RepID=A0A1G7FMY7_9RHOB|nr:hypothetical protein SAMN04488239_1376 [Ruegeria marina]